MFRVLEALNWEVPDWIVVPGGNLGNVSSLRQGVRTNCMDLGLISTGKPRLAVVNAAGADTFYQLHTKAGVRWAGGKPDAGRIGRYFRDLEASGAKADTLGSAIEINHPVNLPKGLRALDWCDGVVREAADGDMLDAKAKVGAGGLGCEPASAAGVAGLRQLVAEGVVGRDERVVCVLTGHLLKDPTATVAYHTADRKVFDEVLGKRGVKSAVFANRAVPVANDLAALVAAVRAAG